jgi:acyl-coenzyme A synthetase/AMP-(fatty) acid ligase
MFASPALLNRVGRYGKEKGIKLPTLKRVISAGAPATPANIEQFSAMLTGGAQIHTGYGATEAMPVSSFGSDEILSETRKLSEQGLRHVRGPTHFSGIDLRIIRISDGPIARWTDDLACRTGKSVKLPFAAIRSPAAISSGRAMTPMAKIDDGDTFWHRMGDLGWMDKKGRIWFCGRKSHRVVTEKRPCSRFPVKPYSTITPACSAAPWSVSALGGNGRWSVSNWNPATAAEDKKGLKRAAGTGQIQPNHRRDRNHFVSSGLSR